jgi:hypothetical protein
MFALVTGRKITRDLADGRAIPLSDTTRLLKLKLFSLHLRSRNRIKNKITNYSKQAHEVQTQTIHIHTYHSRPIPEGVADASQILLRDAHVLSKLLSCEQYRRRDRW